MQLVFVLLSDTSGCRQNASAGPAEDDVVRKVFRLLQWPDGPSLSMLSIHKRSSLFVKQRRSFS